MPLLFYLLLTFMFGLSGRLTFFLLYFLVVNFLTFFVWGADKHKAIKHKRRIKEKTLLSFTAVGGFIGGLIGMSLFHHKNIKSSFLIRFWTLSLAWIIIMIFALFTLA